MDLKFRKFFIYIFSLVSGLLIATAGLSQSSMDYKWYANVNGGFTQMYGDISTGNNPIDKLNKETEFGYGIRFGRYISPVFTGHFQFIKENFKGFKESSNLEFKSNQLEFQLGTTVNFSNLFFENKNRRLSVYGLIGVSGLFFRSEAWRSTTGEAVNSFGYTESDPPEKSSREFGLTFPMGGGLDLRLNDQWFINLETALRLGLTDKLDAYEAGKHNDSYYYTSLGVSYNFGTKKPKPSALTPTEIVTTPPDPYANLYVDLLYFFPEELNSMEEFTMRCKIYKGAVQGKGELTQILPIGFNVIDTTIGGASRVEFRNYTLTLFWDELPTDSIFEITYNVQLDKIYGTLPMNSILYLNQTRKEYRFKTDVFIKRIIIAEPVAVDEEIPEEEDMSSPSERVEFRVQIRASYKARLSADSLQKKFNLDTEVKEELVDGWYKYSIGSFKTYDEARAFRNEMVTRKVLKDAFIIAYFDEQRLNALSELKDIAPEVLPGGKPKPKITKYQENGICYRVQIFALMHKRVNPTALKDNYEIEEDINEEVYHNWRKYTVGDCLSKAEALKTRKELITKGLEGSFVVSYKNGERSTIK